MPRISATPTPAGRRTTPALNTAARRTPRPRLQLPAHRQPARLEQRSLHDLQSAATTPAFSWISPNNCSDGHDAVCKGNNLSGGFSTPTTPNEPVNYTGGLYSADLFLEHVIPEIEESPAFKEGGLIDITFDEGYPPFTYSSD